MITKNVSFSILQKNEINYNVPNNVNIDFMMFHGTCLKRNGDIP